MATKLETVFQKAAALPHDLQDRLARQWLAELVDAAPVRSNAKRTRQAMKRKPKPHKTKQKRPMTGKDLVKSGLFGIWKDRTDFGDNLEFARKLRKQAETRHHEIHDPA